MSGRFDGKVALMTGAGSGIAAASARRFTAEGGRVAVVDFDAAAAELVAKELDGAIALQADVADEESVAAAVQATADAFGGLDCVLSAAGHAAFGAIEDWTLESFHRMFAVHAGGTFLVCKYALPLLRARGGGSIVAVASTAALVSNNHNAVYGGAKGAILAFARQVAREAAPSVRVNVVAPGRTLTGMTEAIVRARGDGDLEAGGRQFGVGNLQGRTAAPEELAAPICFLLSDEASFMTGSLVVVDGGETAI